MIAINSLLAGIRHKHQLDINSIFQLPNEVKEESSSKYGFDSGLLCSLITQTSELNGDSPIPGLETPKKQLIMKFQKRKHKL